MDMTKFASEVEQRRPRVDQSTAKAREQMATALERLGAPADLIVLMGESFDNIVTLNDRQARHEMLVAAAGVLYLLSLEAGE